MNWDCKNRKKQDVFVSIALFSEGNFGPHVFHLIICKALGYFAKRLRAHFGKVLPLLALVHSLSPENA
jgi:hypothetical protein